MSVRDINVEFRFFLIKCFVKDDFLEFKKYSTWLTVQIWAAKCESGRYNKFWILLSPHQKLFFFCRFEVVGDKNIRHETCCLYVSSYSLPLPCKGS